jgi:hypothetical protein
LWNGFLQQANAGLRFASLITSPGSIFGGGLDLGIFGAQAPSGGRAQEQYEFAQNGISFLAIALGGLVAGPEEAAADAAEGVSTLSSSAIRFRQSSVNGVGEIAESMAARGWVGAPIDVVEMENGLVTVDNTRLLAAHMTDTPVQAIIHGAGDALPEAMAGRFGAATTWGEAVSARIGGQNAAYRSLFPGGSWATGVTP